MPAALEKTPCLVTGGNGFLGQHLVQQLVKSGKYAVTVFDIRPPAERIVGVEYIVGDLTKPADVDHACNGQTVVFHCATAVPTATNAANLALMGAVNVGGTRQVVDACERAGVKRLIYTSSASVVFGGQPLHLVDENQPYASPPLDAYSTTKAEGERIVLGADGRGALRTLALRPSGIFGEYDTLMVPSIVANARRGKLKYIVGNGLNMMDYTYAGNVASAHLDADRALAEQEESTVSGRAFFITNDEPRPFWGVMGDVCEGLGYPRPSVHLPFGLVYLIALLMVYVIVPLVALFGKTIESDFTPARLKLAAVNRTFSCEAAKRELGYTPTVSMDEGLHRTIHSFEYLRNDEKTKET